jgi:outer membrane protein assembly factor BamB
MLQFQGVGYNYYTSGNDGTIFIGLGSTMYAFDPDTGIVKWSYQTSSSRLSSASIAYDGTVYVGGNDGYLYAFNGNGAEEA